MTKELSHLEEWIGRTESHHDVATATPVQALAAALDRDDPPPRFGDPVPPAWHWLYFLPLHRQSELGPDGHPKRGGFLPPVALPRRMWAGSRLEFPHPLSIGSAIRRESRIVDVSAKEGRSGPLVFVNVRHEISDEERVVIVEEHDIVYRGESKPGDASSPPQLAPPRHDWSRTIEPSEVLLFRYSALTFNGHRIHYDRRYCTAVEGYPGLVVHGPLIATLLLDLLRRNMPEATVVRFSFRALKPTFDVEPFQVCGVRNEDGQSVRLWAQRTDGALAMDAAAILSSPV